MLPWPETHNNIYEEVCQLMIIFLIYKNNISQISQIFEVSYNLFGNSLRYDIKTSQLFCYTGTSFY